MSSVVAGVEWHAGLRARSLNQIFAAVVITAAVVIVKRVAPA